MELTANGVRLHDEVSGQGPAVVLLHGNGANLHFFDALTALLEPWYTVYRLDSRRHGKSEKTKEISYDLMAQDTAAFIQALGRRLLWTMRGISCVTIQAAFEHTMARERLRRKRRKRYDASAIPKRGL